jgi:hypothetical protein
MIKTRILMAVKRADQNRATEIKKARWQQRALVWDN